MSSASLAVSRHAHPDRARIAALSAAMALNLAVIVIASRPNAPAPFALHKMDPTQLIRLIEPPPPVPPPTPVEVVPLPHPPIAPIARVQPVPIGPPVALPSVEGNVAAPPVSMPSVLPGSVAPGTATAPIEASLAYRSAPLHFPTRALQQRMQGTVLLRVLVDESGKPVQVAVERSSGYGLLDRSATEQVLAGWLFQPAMLNGQAVRAWARVPVKFSLRE